jgi:hypothetical protein
MAADYGLLLENDRAHARTRLGKLQSCRESDNPAPHYQDRDVASP